jgi:hypothetical protein
MHLGYIDGPFVKLGVNPRSKTLEPDRLQHDRPAACVIAQQYSSATFVSLRFHSRREKFGKIRKCYYINFTYFLQNWVRKLRNLKLP